MSSQICVNTACDSTIPLSQRRVEVGDGHRARPFLAGFVQPLPGARGRLSDESDEAPPFPAILLGYPLVNVYVAMENHHV